MLGRAAERGIAFPVECWPSDEAVVSWVGIGQDGRWVERHRVQNPSLKAFENSFEQLLRAVVVIVLLQQQRQQYPFYSGLS